MSSAFSHADIVAVTAASIAERDRRAAGFERTTAICHACKGRTDPDESIQCAICLDHGVLTIQRIVQLLRMPQGVHATCLIAADYLVDLIAERDRRSAGFDLCACGRHGVWSGSEYLCDRCEATP